MQHKTKIEIQFSLIVQPCLESCLKCGGAEVVLYYASLSSLCYSPDYSTQCLFPPPPVQIIKKKKHFSNWHKAFFCPELKDTQIWGKQTEQLRFFLMNCSIPTRILKANFCGNFRDENIRLVSKFQLEVPVL